MANIPSPLIHLERISYDLDRTIAHQHRSIERSVADSASCNRAIETHRLRNQLLLDQLARLSILAADAHPLRLALKRTRSSAKAAEQLCTQLEHEVNLLRKRVAPSIVLDDPIGAAHCEGLRSRVDQCAAAAREAVLRQADAATRLGAEREGRTVGRKVAEQVVEQYQHRVHCMRKQDRAE